MDYLWSILEESGGNFKIMYVKYFKIEFATTTKIDYESNRLTNLDLLFYWWIVVLHHVISIQATHEVGGFLRVLRFPLPTKLTALI